MKADFLAITFVSQKNGEKCQSIIQHKSNRTLCPIRAWGELITTILSYHIIKSSMQNNWGTKIGIFTRQSRNTFNQNELHHAITFSRSKGPYNYVIWKMEILIILTVYSTSSSRIVKGLIKKKWQQQRCHISIFLRDKRIFHWQIRYTKLHIEIAAERPSYHFTSPIPKGGT